MAIAYDNSVNLSTYGNAGSISGSFTVGSGSDRFLIAYAWGGFGSDTVSSMTYNGVSLTKINSVVCPADRGVSMWYLVNPASGSNTLQVNGSSLFVLVAASYTGVDQSNPIDSNNPQTWNSVTSFAPSTTVVASNCWLVCTGKTAGNTPTAVTGIRRVNEDGGLFDSNGTVGTGSQSISLNISGGANFGSLMASIKPAAAAGPTNVKTWNGVTQSTGIKTYNGLAVASTKSVNGVA